jgi:hypothetical protein
MTQIRTAEEVLINHSFEDEPFNNALKERIILCMQEYAKQFIDLAVSASFEECESQINGYVNEYLDSTYSEMQEVLKECKHDIILEIKDLIR